MGGCNGSEKVSAARSAAMPVRPGQKVVVVVAMEQMQVQTQGSDAIETLYALDLGPIAHLGPTLESLRVEYLADNATANFKGRVIGWWSINGELWEPTAGFEVLSAQTATKQVISADYALRTNFGLKLKLALGTTNVSQQSGVQYARVTIIVEATLRT